MPTTQQIEWADGSGDKIYISASEFSGNQQVAVSSDPNTGAARSKVVTFTAGNVSQTLTVQQAAGAQQEVTISIHPTSYDTTDYNWYSNPQNIANAYTDSDSTTYAGIYAARGNYAETWVYFQFDTSQIPAGATILEVTCKVKASYTANNTIMPTHEVQLFTGTTPKGSATTIGTSASEKTLDVGEWTREELNNVRVRLFFKRSTTQANTSYAGRFYGATLTIKYKI